MAVAGRMSPVEIDLLGRFAVRRDGRTIEAAEVGGRRVRQLGRRRQEATRQEPPTNDNEGELTGVPPPKSFYVRS